MLHAATHCKSLQLTATHYNSGTRSILALESILFINLVMQSCECFLLQHTATHCYSLQHAVIRGLDLFWRPTVHRHCGESCQTFTPQHTAVHFNTLQHSAIPKTKRSKVRCLTLLHTDFIVTRLSDAVIWRHQSPRTRGWLNHVWYKFTHM